MTTIRDAQRVTAAERVEAECRRKMAEKARLPLTWRTRDDHEVLAVEIECLIDEWLALL